MSTKKTVAILGSTGAVGQQALEVIRSFPDKLKLIGLGAGTNYELLSKQVAEFGPPLVSFPSDVPGHDFLTMSELAAHPAVEMLVVATTGVTGLMPTLAAMDLGKTVVLASKEILVMAGDFVIGNSPERRKQVIPVDGALSVIWQCLKGEGGDISNLEIMTPPSHHVRGTLPELKRITLSDPLEHYPTRRAGPKTRIDLATKIHEGMQVIEAHHLFGVPYNKIKATVHPEEVMASVVGFSDGSKKSILTSSPMSVFLQYAFSHPQRWPNERRLPLDLRSLGKLTFQKLEEGIFPCFQLALEAGKRGDTYPAVLNAANETAVRLFIRRQIGFTEIPRIIRAALEAHKPVSRPSLDDILAADEWSRAFAVQQVAA